MTTAKDVLVAARDLVARPGGWIQGRFGVAADGPHCATGAICTAAGKGTTDTPHHLLEAESIRVFTQAIGDRIPERWNDAPDRTQADVIAAFDAAIALWEREQGGQV